MRTASFLLLVLPLLHGFALAASFDEGTLAGMDAVVSGNWIAAVRSFEEALAADPEDPGATKRLAHARKRARAFWEDARRRSRAEGLEEGVALANAAIARIDARPEAPANAASEHPEARLRAILRYGKHFDRGREISRGAVRFLLAATEREGFWDSTRHGGHRLYREVVTGLAILALITGDGSPMDGARRKAVDRGVDWLLKVQSREGRFGLAADGHFLYGHAVVTEALAAYAMNGGEIEKLRPALEKAVRFIEFCRNPGLAWRYGVKPGDNDTSMTLWVVGALYRANATGIKVDPTCFEGAHAWVNQATEPEWGRAGYTARGTGPARPEGQLDRFPVDQSESLTAAACLIRHWCGERRTPIIDKHFALIGKVRPTGEVPDMYYWHVGAKAYATVRGRIPAEWYAALVKGAERCRGNGGSIEPSGPWGGGGGRIYSTAVTSLALMAPLEGTAASGTTTASDFHRRGWAKLTVPITETPTPAGIYLDETMKLTAEPTGTVQYCPGVPAAEPAGLKKDPPGRKRVTRKLKFGCLVGRIGETGKPFVIRRKGSLRVNGCGELFVFVNAEKPVAATGGFELTIRVGK